MNRGEKGQSLSELIAIARISGPLADAHLAEIAMGIADMLFVVLRSFVAALSRTGSVMVVTVAAIGVNALFTYGLVFGKLGMPALGAGRPRGLWWGLALGLVREAPLLT